MKWLRDHHIIYGLWIATWYLICVGGVTFAAYSLYPPLAVEYNTH